VVFTGKKQLRGRHIPEDHIHHSHCCENLTANKMFLFEDFVFSTVIRSYTRLFWWLFTGVRIHTIGITVVRCVTGWRVLNVVYSWHCSWSYSGKMRKRGCIVSKLLAKMLCKSGLTHVITMDLHQKEIQGFFDCPVDNLRASPFLLQYIQECVSDEFCAYVYGKLTACHSCVACNSALYSGCPVFDSWLITFCWLFYDVVSSYSM
jgi:hypothetical protein